MSLTHGMGMNPTEKDRDRVELNCSKPRWISSGKRDPFSIRQGELASLKREQKKASGQSIEKDPRTDSDKKGRPNPRRCRSPELGEDEASGMWDSRDTQRCDGTL